MGEKLNKKQRFLINRNVKLTFSVAVNRHIKPEWMRRQRRKFRCLADRFYGALSGKSLTLQDCNQKISGDVCVERGTIYRHNYPGKATHIKWSLTPAYMSMRNADR